MRSCAPARPCRRSRSWCGRARWRSRVAPRARPARWARRATGCRSQAPWWEASKSVSHWCWASATIVCRRRTRAGSRAARASPRLPPRPWSAGPGAESSSPTPTSPMVVQPVGVGSGVSRASALPMAGRAGDDDHLPGVEAVGEVVELGEAGGYAVEAGLAVADRLDLVEDLVHDVGERRVVLGRRRSVTG